MQRLRSRPLVGPILESSRTSSRRLCTSSEKIVASVLFERLRVVIPKPDPAVYTFQEFKSVLGDLTHTYFVGNAPMAHMAIQPTEEAPDLPSYKRFFFKCSVVAASKYNISNCEDFVWVTKDELLQFFPEQAEFFNKMIIS